MGLNPVKTLREASRKVDQIIQEETDEPRQRAAVTTAYDDYPTALCSCGTSFHDREGERARHEATHHSVAIPASYRLFDQRGDVAVEIESREAFYANTEDQQR
jgi:hypothetical protein